jgi:hypothetical protein
MATRETPAEEETPSSQGGKDRFEAFLEERFSRAGRREMAHQIASHDEGRAPEAFDAEHVRRKLRFHGDVPDKVKAALREWVPELLAYAAESGLRLRDLNHELHFYQRAVYEAQVAPVPPGVKLPASSYAYNQLYRIYTVRVVLPERITGVSQLLTVLRAALGRMLGDVFLREEIFTLEAYREDVEGGEAEVSVGTAEKIRVLAEGPFTSPELERALAAHGKAIGVNYRRAPDQVRKAFFKDSEESLAKQKLPEEREALINATFETFLERLRNDLPGGIAEMVEAVEKLNGQLNFLPPDELPDYLQLRDGNPAHYLRSANLRLGFLLEALGTVVDLQENVDQPELPLSPMIEEQAEGYLSQLRTENLARPYLIPDVQLSEELEKKKAAFPFEVHGLLARMPASDNPDRAFKSLSHKLTNSIYQRLYTALLIVSAWGKTRLQGQDEAFRASQRFRSLTGAIANFRFRKPLLESLFIRIGVVLDFSQSARGGERMSGRRRFPVEGFARAWGLYIPHVLVAGFFARRGSAPGLDPGKYRESMESALRAQVAEAAGPAHLAYCLREIHRQSGEEPPGVLLELLRSPSGTFRFTVAQALAPPPAEQTSAERLEQLSRWAGAVVQARAASLKHAIVVGDSS